MSIGGLDEFLQRKGSVEIIVEIGTGSSTFQNIEKAVLVSSSTISNRLHDGFELDLFDITHRPTEHGTQKRYELASVGKRVFDWIQEIDMDSTVRELQRVQRRRDQDLERLIDHVKRDTSLQHLGSPPAESFNNVDHDEIPYSDVTESDPEEKRKHMEKQRREKLESDLHGEMDLDEDEEENEDE